MKELCFKKDIGKRRTEAYQQKAMQKKIFQKHKQTDQTDLNPRKTAAMLLTANEERTHNDTNVEHLLVECKVMASYEYLAMQQIALMVLTVHWTKK